LLVGSLVVAGCSTGTRAAAVSAAGAGQDTVGADARSLVSTGPASAMVSLRGALPSAPSTVGVPPHHDFSVPARWRFFDAGRRWLAFADVRGGPGSERIVLMNADSGAASVVLAKPLTRAPALAITDVRVSDRWIAWEETSPYDIELGPAAVWRIYVAPIAPGPRLGRARLVDSGTVASRTRCVFAFDSDTLVYSLTEALRREAVTGRVLAARTGLVRFVPATGRSSVVATFPGAIDAFAAVDARAGGRAARGFVVVRREGPDLAMVRVTSLDGSGVRLTPDAALPAGTDTVRYPAADAAWVALATVGTAGEEDPRVWVADRGLRLRWIAPLGSQDAVVAGGRIVYRVASRSAPAGSPLTSSLVMLDPVTGAQRLLATSPVSSQGSWVLPSSGRDPRRVWAILDRSAEAIEAGRTRSVVRCYELP
jgi:hypothetical protein